MDSASKWDNLAKAPSLKNLTEGGFGVLKDSQHAAVQDLTKAHIESFDQAVTEGLSSVVQVRFKLSFKPLNVLLFQDIVNAYVR